MTKYTNLLDARTAAYIEDLAFGLCVFDGAYYVGTQKELEAIGARPVDDEGRVVQRKA